MDLIKKLTGKNPSEYEVVAKNLVNNSDVELFANIVKQDDFLFDFIKNNVAKRIQNACNKDNYHNLLNFLDNYSPSYDTMIASVLHSFGGETLFGEMKELFLNGSNSQKAYAAKYFTFTPELAKELLPQIRIEAKSEFEPLSMNSIELLSLLKDEVSKAEAFKNLENEDEFIQYDAVKFLVNYQAKDTLDKIIEVMKKSSLSENIASEILYLISIDELIEKDIDTACLVLCYIINAIPDIISPASICGYGLCEVFKNLPLTSSTAVVLRLAKDKFEELLSNDEYLFDCDKNTKDEIKEVNEFLKGINTHKLKSLFYDELFDGSDFVFFALDFVDEVEELETLLDSENQTLILKVLTVLKERNQLNSSHKNIALNNITSDDIKQIVEVL